jgi:hypothetical protein
MGPGWNCACDGRYFRSSEPGCRLRWLYPPIPGTDHVRLLVRPPIDCVRCGSRRFYPSHARIGLARPLGRFLYYYRCHDCDTAFWCLSRSRVHWSLRTGTALALVIGVPVLIGAAAWVALSCWR